MGKITKLTEIDSRWESQRKELVGPNRNSKSVLPGNVSEADINDEVDDSAAYQDELISFNDVQAADLEMNSYKSRLRIEYQMRLALVGQDEELIDDARTRLETHYFNRLAYLVMMKEREYAPYDEANKTGLMDKEEIAKFYSQLMQKELIEGQPLEHPGVRGITLPSAAYFVDGHIEEVFMFTSGESRMHWGRFKSGYLRDIEKFPDIFGKLRRMTMVTPFNFEIKSDHRRALRPDGSYISTHIQLEAVDEKFISDEVDEILV